MRIKILILLCTITMLSACSKKESIEYLPFENIAINITGSEGKGVLTINTVEVEKANIDLVNNSKKADKLKVAEIELIKKATANGTYTISQENKLKNGDEVVISFSIPEDITGVKIKESTFTYKVESLSLLFTTKDDLAPEEYIKVKDKAHKLSNDYIRKLATSSRTYSELTFQGQYILERKSDTDGSKSIITLFNGISSESMVEGLSLNEYIYAYAVCDVGYNAKGQPEYNYNIDDIDYVSRYYQTDDITDIFDGKFDVINFEVIESVGIKAFTTINDLPNGYMKKFDELANAEIAKTLKAKENTAESYSTPTFYKCYLMTDYYDSVNSTKNQKNERKSIVLVYKFYSESDSMGKQYYYFYKNLNYFLYDKNNALIDYKTTSKLVNYIKDLTESEIIDYYKTKDSTMEEVPF